jgi:uncharacterized protein (TIGR03435 family)
MTATTVRALIFPAYGVPQDYALVGGSSWLRSDHFDIVAQAPEGLTMVPNTVGGLPGTMQLMLRALLADRFKVAYIRKRERYRCARWCSRSRTAPWGRS